MKFKILMIISIFIILSTSILITSVFMSNGVSSLPENSQPYGEAAIRTAYSGLDNPIQKLLARKLKVLSIKIDDKTGKINSVISVRSFFGIQYCYIELYGKVNHEDDINMGFTHIIIE